MTDQLERTLVDQRDRVYTGWRRFDRIVSLRPKILVSVFSAPGVGKSMWGLNLVHQVEVVSLYSTIDTPLSTQAIRSWTLLSGATMPQVEKNPKAFMRAANRARVGSGGHIEWNDTPVSIDEFPHLVEGVREVLGQAPRIIIIDVVGDVVKERSYEGFTHAFAGLKAVAHRYRATSISLHHTTKNKDPDDPVYLSDCEYAGDKQPDIVIGMYSKGQHTIRANILKNRLGPSNPYGRVGVDFHADYKRALIEEW